MNENSLIILLLILSISSNSIFNIEIHGNRIYKYERLKKEVFNFYIGKPLSKETIEELINKLLLFYEENGFPFAEVRPVAMKEEEGGISVVLFIDEGSPGLVNRVMFEGNRRTRESFLRRFFPFENKLFNSHIFDRDKRRLEKMGFIQVKGYRFTKKEGLNLVIELDEVESNRVFGGLSYDAERRGLLGEIEFFSKNLFGTGRGFELRWRRVSLGEQIFHIKYREPFLFSLDLAFNIGFNYEFRDTLFLKKIGFVEGDFMRDYFTFTVGAQYESFDDLVLKRYESDILSIMGVKFDSRYLYFPRKGILLEGRGEVSKKKQKIKSKGEILIPIMDFLVLSPSIQFFNITRKGEIGPSELIPVGGTGNLRGYMENRFLVKEAFLSGLEVHLYLDENFIFYPFIDTALLDKKNFYYGYGIGIKAPVKQGILNLSYALSPERSYREGTIHFTLEGQF